ncbi:MAG: tagatose 6-phosphate kinase [Candidatus Atribacteria bacterium]|nr:tagatose 6-phosphate kinase [Candidatus Atribacteria bacterium]
MVVVVTPNPCVDKTLFIKENRWGEKIPVREVQEVAGGKGSNVSRVLKTWGEEVKHLLFLGGYTGSRVKELLEEEKIDTYPVETESFTRVVTTVVDEKWQQTVYFEPNPQVKDEELEDFIACFWELEKEGEIFLFCGSVPSSIPSVYRELGKRVSSGKKIIIDSRGEALRLALDTSPWLLKMNWEEAETTWGRKIENQEDLKQFFDFISSPGSEKIILTRGEKGAILKDGGEIYFALSPQVRTVNPIGSGDAFLGAFVYALQAGFNLVECLRWGVAAGACNARVWDVCRLEKKEVEEMKEKVIVEDTITSLW